jgi:ribosomal protein L11 methyltransferase
MPWLELSIIVDTAQQQRAEAALADLGALSITLQDADADTPDEHAIFEPGVGELPVWQSIVLQALFSAHADRGGLAAAIEELVPGLDSRRIGFREVADQDWTRAWMDRFEPMRFGRRLWICPHAIEAPAACAGGVIVRLDPGLAFGTGTHPTTALCLEWLDAVDLAGKTLIDYGCGSGVLAIAALKLGAQHAIGVDNDEQALTASRDNAGRNGVSDKLDLYTPERLPVLAAEVLVANILAGPLADLAAHFAQLTQSGGALALSGILHGQENELLACYGRWFEQIEVAVREDWVRISATRRIDS